MTYKSLLSVFLLFCIGTLTFLFLLFFSFSSTVQHWETVMLPCTECVDSFLASFFHTNHLVSAVILFFCGFGLVRLGLYLFREYRFQRTAKRSTTSDMTLVSTAPYAAWSGGLFFPSIYVDNLFWQSLTPKEKTALRIHEQYHVRYRHGLLFFFLHVLIALFPLPIVSRVLYKFLEHCRLISELSADDAAIRATNRMTVASLLQKVIAYETTATHFAPAFSNEISERVKYITNVESRKTISLFRYIVLACIVFCVTAVGSLALFSAFSPLQSCIS